MAIPYDHRDDVRTGSFGIPQGRYLIAEDHMTGVIEAPGLGHNQPDPLEMEKKN